MSRSSRLRSSRQGVSALVVALIIVVLLGFVALVVDLGYVRLVQTQLQAGTDVAALGAARVLDDTVSGLEDSRTAAVEIAAANSAMGVSITVDRNDLNSADGGVVLGHWDKDLASFTPSLDPVEVNAVRVTAQRDDVATWFAAVLEQGARSGGGGRYPDEEDATRRVIAGFGFPAGTLAFAGPDHLTISATSLAAQGLVLGAASVPYYLNFAVPLCQMEGHSPAELMSMTFRLAPATEDNMGWAAVGTSPSSNWVDTHVSAILPCMHEWAEDGKITTACSPVQAGSSVSLGNGADTAALKSLIEGMALGIPWSTDRWGALPPQESTSDVKVADYGIVLEGPLPVFDGGADYCTASAPWNQTFPVVGYVWGVIYDVAWQEPALRKNVWVKLDLAHNYGVGDWYGGNNYGVTFTGPPTLVK